MRIRSGFVSNSSSSSFVIQKKRYSKDELEIILDPKKYESEIKKILLNKLMYSEDLTREESEYQLGNYGGLDSIKDVDLWSVNVRGDEIKFYTDMDNFQWDEFVKVVERLNKEEIERIVGVE
ncbi:MAG: hypothetical protein ACOCQD_02160 [archaeon]